jgi:hypothetical protein
MVEARLASMSRRKEGFVIRSFEQAADTTAYTNRAMLVLRVNPRTRTRIVIVIGEHNIKALFRLGRESKESFNPACRQLGSRAFSTSLSASENKRIIKLSFDEGIALI